MCRLRENRKPVAWLVAGAWLLATAMPVTAAAASGGDQWEYDAMIYLWAPAIDANTESGGDIDISFNDIVDDLDLALMGTLGARKGKWSVALDTIYMDISQNEGGSETIPILGTSRSINTDIDMKASITTFGGGYNLVDDERVKLDLIVGGRYLWVDVDSKLDLDRAGGPLPPTARALSVSDSEHNWDGIVGARGQFTINDKWYMPYYADVGTGQSDLTWQTMTGIGYKFTWGDVLLVYRYLDYEFDSDYVLKDLTVSGPALGARFKF